MSIKAFEFFRDLIVPKHLPSTSAFKQDPRLQGRAPGFRQGQDRYKIWIRQGQDRDKTRKRQGKDKEGGGYRRVRREEGGR